MKVAARSDESERLDRALLAIFHRIGNHALASTAANEETLVRELQRHQSMKL